MHYRISHQIRYAYTVPVFLEPHIVRLQPRTDPCHRISDFTMTVDPQPAGIHHFLDTEGNQAACLWFEELTGSLAISTSFAAHTFCTNPFGYLVADQNFLHLPAQYSDHEAVSLAPYLQTGSLNNEVTAFGRSIIAEVSGNTLHFLNRLCTSIYENYTVEVRDDGPAFLPETTMQGKKGACRDLAFLFMAVCRSAGLAARFVSGYQEGDEIMDNRHLHAWAEVYIPGGGWRGYDPSHGLVVSDRHVPVAASHYPAGAAAVTGTFRGTGVSAKMSYSISLDTLPE